MNQETPNEPLKIVLIGDSSVGKTSLIHRFVEDTYVADQPNTIGVDFFAKKLQIEGKTHSIQIWDTAGQERFKSMIRTYFRSASAALLVFDLTKKASFDHVNAWLTTVQEDMDPKAPIVIVGSKSDLVDQRAIPEKNVRSFANKLGLEYFEVSSLNSEGVQNLFKSTVKKIIDGQTDPQNSERKRSTRVGSELHHLMKDKETPKEPDGCCGF